MSPNTSRLPLELLPLAPIAAQATAAEVSVARIVAVDPSGECDVALGERRLTAGRALSCLVEPAVGDLVLVAEAAGRAFVLAVLERTGGDRHVLSVGAGEPVTLAASELHLAATGSIRASAPDVRVEGEAIGLTARSLSLVGTLLTFLGDRLRNAVRNQETVADQVALSTRERVTVVGGADVQKLGLLSQSVEGTATLTAETAVVVTRKDMRLDGERISMG